MKYYVFKYMRGQRESESCPKIVAWLWWICVALSCMLNLTMQCTNWVIGEELRVLLNLMFLGFITMNWNPMNFMWSSFTLFMYHMDLALLHTVMCMNSVRDIIRLDLE